MNTQTHQQADVWERYSWLWDFIFYTTFIGSVALTYFDDSATAPFWLTALLTTVLLLWHAVGMALIYRQMTTWEAYAGVRFLIIVGDALLWMVLVNISPAFYLALFGLFSQVFRHLPIRYAAVAILLLTVGIISEQVADSANPLSLTDPLLWLFGFIGLATILLGLWVSAIIGQSTRRRELIEELEATQAELAAAERREGTLEERQRLAREIHDTLAQGFTSIVLHLEAADQALPDDLESLQRHLDQARATARESLDQARRVVQDLRPDLLEQQSLPDAIERTAARFQAESGLRVGSQTTGTPVPLHPEIEVTLLRATQEALNNVRKHAQATAVQVTLSYMGDTLILDVQDDGVGLAGAAPSPFAGGYGLQAMEERVQQCGGEVMIESEPGEGTTVVVTIPLAGGVMAQQEAGAAAAVEQAEQGQ